MRAWTISTKTNYIKNKLKDFKGKDLLYEQDIIIFD